MWLVATILNKAGKGLDHDLGKWPKRLSQKKKSYISSDHLEKYFLGVLPAT